MSAIGRRLSVWAIALLVVATSAHAQSRGGGGGGGGGGQGRRGGSTTPTPSTTTSPDQPAPRAATPTNKVDITGVVKEIGPAEDRITIAYDAVEALNWPAGVMPFVVAKTDLLKGVTVGEKVRFRLDSQQISSLAPL